MISIIIPTRNEAGCIRRTLQEIARALAGSGEEYDIIVMDDASADLTVAEVSAESNVNPHVRLVQRAPPHGFGIAIREGIGLAKGDACVIVMGDLSDDLDRIPEMKRALDAGADLVIGSRFVKGGHVEGYPWAKMVSNRLFSAAMGIGLLHPISDASNAFRMFRPREALALGLESHGFEISGEITGRYIANGARIREVPVSWSDRTAGKAKFNLGKEAPKYFALYLKIVRLRYARLLGRTR